MPAPPAQLYCLAVPPCRTVAPHGWNMPACPAPPCLACRLILEDEGARLALCGDKLPVGECVTGVVAAVRGHVLPNGDFEALDLCYAGLPPQAPLPAVGEDK